MDFLNKAIDQAKQLQQKAAEAIEKGQEQAKPFLDEAVAKAQDLQKTVAERAPDVGEALQHVADHAKHAADSAVDAITDAVRQKGPPPPGSRRP